MGNSSDEMNKRLKDLMEKNEGPTQRSSMHRTQGLESKNKGAVVTSPQENGLLQEYNRLIARIEELKQMKKYVPSEDKERESSITQTPLDGLLPFYEEAARKVNEFNMEGNNQSLSEKIAILKRVKLYTETLQDQYPGVLREREKEIEQFYLGKIAIPGAESLERYNREYQKLQQELEKTENRLKEAKKEINDLFVAKKLTKEDEKERLGEMGELKKNISLLKMAKGVINKQYLKFKASSVEKVRPTRQEMPAPHNKTLIHSRQVTGPKESITASQAALNGNEWNTLIHKIKNDHWKINKDRSASAPQALRVKSHNATKEILVENTSRGIIAKPASNIVGHDDMRSLALMAFELAQVTQGQPCTLNGCKPEQAYQFLAALEKACRDEPGTIKPAIIIPKPLKDIISKLAQGGDPNAKRALGILTEFEPPKPKNGPDNGPSLSSKHKQ